MYLLSIKIFSALGLLDRCELIKGHVCEQDHLRLIHSESYIKAQEEFHCGGEYSTEKEVQHLAVCYKPLDQYTTINCINPYSKELNKSLAASSSSTQNTSGNHGSATASSQSQQQSMSNYVRSYLKCVSCFERLYH